MATFEIETIEYNSYGSVKKQFELFGTKKEAIQHMKNKVKERNGLVQQGQIKDGEVKFFDDRGTVRRVVKFGQL